MAPLAESVIKRGQRWFMLLNSAKGSKREIGFNPSIAHHSHHEGPGNPGLRRIRS